MYMYCNYALEHWTLEGENPSVGLILCASKDAAVAHYALEGLPNKVLAAEYRTALPDAGTLAAELERTRKLLERRCSLAGSSPARGVRALASRPMRADAGWKGADRR